MRARVGIVDALVVAVVALLMTGCTAAAPEANTGTGEFPSPATSSAPAGTDKPEKPNPEAAGALEAVVVVAGPDVDGEHISASGYVAGAIEDDGSCTFQFTRDGTTVEAGSRSVADRLTSSCGTVQVDSAELARGTWSVQLSYVGESGSAVSEPVEFEVP